MDVSNIVSIAVAYVSGQPTLHVSSMGDYLATTPAIPNSCIVTQKDPAQGAARLSGSYTFTKAIGGSLYGLSFVGGSGTDGPWQPGDTVVLQRS